MTTLKQLKAQFLDFTGMEANKSNAYAVCSNLGDRKMISKADWGFALANIVPEKTLKFQPTFRDLVATIEIISEKFESVSSTYEEIKIEYHQELEALKAENIKLRASADAFKQSNELYADDFSDMQTEIEQLKTEVEILKMKDKDADEIIASQSSDLEYLRSQLGEIEQLKTENEQLKAMDKDSDETIARLRNEIQFLNKELMKSFKNPLRVIQLEKRIQKLEDEIEYLQRENRILQSSRHQKTAILNSTPAAEAFSDFCYALPLEWVSVFVHSFLANSSDLKTTYRKLSHKFHPDANRNNPRSAELFRTLNESYDVLRSAKEREQDT